MKKILIIKMSSMGDVLHALPVLADIKNAFGKQTQIDWVVEPNYASLLAQHPLINQVYPLPLRKYKNTFKRFNNPNTKKLKQLLRQQSYDVVLDLQGLLKSAIVSRWAKAPVYGYNKKSIREPLASYFYQHKFQVDKSEHAITRMRELTANALSYTLPNTLPDYRLNTYKASAQDVKSNIILFPFTTWQSKHWPKHHWQSCIKLLSENYNIYIAWGSDEEHKQATEFIAHQSHCQLTPQLNIKQMQQFLLNMHAFIGVDTGFAHLATAMDIPGIVLMGPTDKHRSGPLGERQLALDVSLPCRPCHKRQCHLPEIAGELRPACMAALSPTMVLQHLQQLIKSK